MKTSASLLSDINQILKYPSLKTWKDEEIEFILTIFLNSSSSSNSQYIFSTLSTMISEKLQEREEIYKDLFNFLQFLQFFSLILNDFKCQDLSLFFHNYFNINFISEINKKLDFQQGDQLSTSTPTNDTFDNFYMPIKSLLDLESDDDIFILKNFSFIYKDPKFNLLNLSSLYSSINSSSSSPPITYNILSYLAKRSEYFESTFSLIITILEEKENKILTQLYALLLNKLEIIKESLNILLLNYNYKDQLEEFYLYYEENFISIDQEELLSNQFNNKLEQLFYYENINYNNNYNKINPIIIEYQNIIKDNKKLNIDTNKTNIINILNNIKILSLKEEFILILSNIKYLLINCIKYYNKIILNKKNLIINFFQLNNNFYNYLLYNANYNHNNNNISYEDIDLFLFNYNNYKKNNFNYNNNNNIIEWKDLNFNVITLINFTKYLNNYYNNSNENFILTSNNFFIFQLPSYKSYNISFISHIDANLFLTLENILYNIIQSVLNNLITLMQHAKPIWTKLDDYLTIIYQRTDPNSISYISNSSQIQLPPLSKFLPVCELIYSSGIYDKNLLTKVDKVIESTCDLYKKITIMDQSFQNYSYRKFIRLYCMYNSLPKPEDINYISEEENVEIEEYKLMNDQHYKKKIYLQELNNIKKLPICSYEINLINEKKKLLNFFKFLRKIEIIFREGYYKNYYKFFKNMKFSTKNIDNNILNDEKLLSLLDFINKNNDNNIYIPLFSIVQIQQLYSCLLLFSSNFQEKEVLNSIETIKNKIKPSLYRFFYLSFTYFLISNSSTTSNIRSINDISNDSSSSISNDFLPTNSLKFYKALSDFEDYFASIDLEYDFILNSKVLYETEVKIYYFKKQIEINNNYEFIQFVSKLCDRIEKDLKEKDKEIECVLLSHFNYNNEKDENGKIYNETDNDSCSKLIINDVKTTVTLEKMITTYRKNLSLLSINIKQIESYYNELLEQDKELIINENEIEILSLLLSKKNKLLKIISQFINLSSNQYNALTNFKLISLTNPSYLKLIDILKMFLYLQIIDSLSISYQNEINNSNPFPGIEIGNGDFSPLNYEDLKKTSNIQKMLLSSIKDYNQKISLHHILQLKNILFNFPSFNYTIKDKEKKEDSLFLFNKIESIPFFLACTDISLKFLTSLQDIIEKWQMKLLLLFPMLAMDEVLLFSSAITSFMSKRSNFVLEKYLSDQSFQYQLTLNSIEDLEIKLSMKECKTVHKPNSISLNDPPYFSTLRDFFDYFNSSNKINFLKLLKFFNFNKEEKLFSNFFLSSYHPIIFKLILFHFTISQFFIKISKNMNYLYNPIPSNYLSSANVIASFSPITYYFFADTFLSSETDNSKISSSISYKFSNIKELNNLIKFNNIYSKFPLIYGNLFFFLEDLSNLLLFLPLSSVDTPSVICSIYLLKLFLLLMMSDPQCDLESNNTKTLINLIQSYITLINSDSQTLDEFLNFSLPLYNFVSKSFFELDLFGLRELNLPLFLESKSSFIIKYLSIKPLLSSLDDNLLIYSSLSNCPSHYSLPSLDSCILCKINHSKASLYYNLLLNLYRKNRKTLSNEEIKDKISNIFPILNSNISIRHKIIKGLEDILTKKKRKKNDMFFLYESSFLAGKFEQYFFNKNILTSTPSNEEIEKYKINIRHFAQKLKLPDYDEKLIKIINGDLSIIDFFSYIDSKNNNDSEKLKRKSQETIPEEQPKKKNPIFSESRSQNSLEIERKVKLMAEANNFFK